MELPTPKYPEIVIDLEYGQKNRDFMYLWVQKAFPDRSLGNQIYIDWYDECYHLDAYWQFKKTLEWFTVVNIFYTSKKN